MYYERSFKTKRFLMWSLALAVITAVVFSNALQSPALAGTGDVASSPEESRIPVFNCEEDFGIRKALAMLGSMCQKNIVPSPGVDGQLAFRSLRDVTFEEAMDAILGENFVYEEKGNLIKVYTREEYKKIKENPERMVYRVFTLYYMSAAEAVKLIVPVLSSAGSVQASSPVETVGTTGESITTGSGGGDTMALNDTMVVLDYPENIAEVEKLLSELDIRPKQVLVEATILSATLVEGMELGVDLNFFNGVSLTGTEATAADAYNSAVTEQTPLEQIASGGTGTPLETAGFASVGGSGLRIGVSSGDLAAIITALETVTDTTVLANPKILAVNKQLGQVYIGTKIGYNSQTTQTQTSTTQQVEFLDTGTKLSFRPYIGNDGYIRMDIHPKDSSGTLKANDIPDEFSTELATNIMVKDGQTIVIGGLFRDVVVTNRSQIPVLGDLPLIGSAFRGTSDSVTRQEVIVLLTPHIIEEPEQINSEAREDDIRRKRFGAKGELQWTGRSKLAEDRYTKAVGYYLDGDTDSAMKELHTVLKLRPSYLEAIRLKERIIAETSPDELEKSERIMLEAVDQNEAPKWLRR
jgi:type IV pilus assembly protein PilQ